MIRGASMPVLRACGQVRALRLSRELASCVVACVAACTMTSGCSVSMQPQGASMTPPAGTIAPVQSPAAAPAFLVVRGGGDQWRISNAEFRKAVETALGQSQIFSALVAQSAADFRLDVVLGSVRQPLAGGDFTVDLETIWNLYSLRSGRTVWQETVRTSFTATVGEAFNATNRLRLATEGAARANVQAGIARLATAPIASTAVIAQDPAQDSRQKPVQEPN